MASETRHFTPALFSFLRDLRENNNRDWFQANKERYEQKLRHPALQFISDFGPLLRKISPEFNADPRPSGGSLFRIYRDVRFSKDKSPYKAYTGIQFRHKLGKDKSAPGFYLHLAPGEIFMGAGIYQPDGPTVAKIRDAIVTDPAAWKRVLRAKAFSDSLELSGASLKRPPRGYDAEHPLIEDLKRKDFTAFAKLSQKEVTTAGFIDRYLTLCRAGAPLVRFLCTAIDAPY